MGQILHGCATTTKAVRRAIQHSQESLRSLAKRYGVNPKTIAKWRKRSSVADLPTGPRLRWSRKLGQVVKLGSPWLEDGPDDGQTEAIFGRVQGEGCS